MIGILSVKAKDCPRKIIIPDCINPLCSSKCWAKYGPGIFGACFGKTKCCCDS